MTTGGTAHPAAAVPPGRLTRAERLSAARSLERIADAIERGELDGSPLAVAHLRGSIDGLRA